MLKAELRKLYLKKRRDLSAEENNRFSRKIAGNFFSFFNLSEVKFIHLFLSIKEKAEFDTKLILHKIWSDFEGIKTIVPRIDLIRGELENIEFNSKTNIVLNSWQIPEPSGGSLTTSEQLDLVIVPLLCFDLEGHRVGYGKGFYDRLLNNCRKDCLKIGVSFFPPIEKIGDSHEKDVTLDYCVTPEKIYQF